MYIHTYMCTHIHTYACHRQTHIHICAHTHIHHRHTQHTHTYVYTRRELSLRNPPRQALRENTSYFAHGLIHYKPVYKLQTARQLRNPQICTPGSPTSTKSSRETYFYLPYKCAPFSNQRKTGYPGRERVEGGVKYKCWFQLERQRL